MRYLIYIYGAKYYLTNVHLIPHLIDPQVYDIRIQLDSDSSCLDFDSDSRCPDSHIIDIDHNWNGPLHYITTLDLYSLF